MYSKAKMKKSIIIPHVPPTKIKFINNFLFQNASFIVPTLLSIVILCLILKI